MLSTYLSILVCRFCGRVLGSLAHAQSESRYAARPVPNAVPFVNSASVAASIQKGDVLVVVKDLETFTHAAVIPVGSDLSSIRFQGVKAVTLPPEAVQQQMRDL